MAFLDEGPIGDLKRQIFGDPSAGANTAAAGAREAQQQLQQLSAQQWMRQMQGLQQARGAMDPYMSLYNKLYGANVAMPSAQAMPGMQASQLGQKSGPQFGGGIGGMNFSTPAPSGASGATSAGGLFGLLSRLHGPGSAR